jgi:Immunity protein 35
MLKIEQARKIVLDTIQSMEYSVPNDKLIILDNLTIEKPYAWIFTYTSKLWHETEDNKYALGGNAPIIVDKKSGEQTSYSTAFSLDTLIDKYEEEKSGV